MPESKRLWRIAVSVLLVVLVLATTMGMVWHHHDQCSAGDCMLCHLIIASPAAVDAAIGLTPVTADYAVLESRFVSRCSTTEKPPRAPPV